MNVIDACIDKGIKKVVAFQQIRLVIQLIYMVQQNWHLINLFVAY